MKQLGLFEESEELFDFDLMKSKLIENLDSLKNMSVTEQTLYKKWKEMNKKTSLKHSKSFPQLRNKLWAPTDIYNEELTIDEINSIEPEVVYVSDKNEVTEWVNVRKLIHTMEWVANPGRNLKFWVKDKSSGKILGQICVGSDVTSIKVRDAYIGWNKDNKFKDGKLNNTCIATTIVSTQPGGYNMLMGKLVAALTTCKVIRDTWESKYGNKLIAVGTTSLYGIHSMYNGIPHFKTLGETNGKIRLKPDDEVYLPWNKWLKENHPDEHKKAINGTGPKQNIINKVFKHCGIKPTDYDHGFKRGVYLAMLYDNGNDFLNSKIDDSKLTMKKKFIEDIDYTTNWWKPKAIRRYKSLMLNNKIKKGQLFYSDVCNLDWDKTKEKYLVEVGR